MKCIMTEPGDGRKTVVAAACSTSFIDSLSSAIHRGVVSTPVRSSMFSTARSSINRALLGISQDEALFSRRGFLPADRAKQRRLEHIGQTFIAGYETALPDRPVEELAHDLNQFEQERRGFAYEGAAMALVICDSLWRQNRFQKLLNGDGYQHRYMMHVGFGWAMARLPWLRRNPAKILRAHDPLLGCLIVDGYGFHEGYFHWQSTIVRHNVPSQLGAGAIRLFDQGLGRSLWFFNSADTERILRCVNDFPSHRHGDLWSGVGLAAAYAGGASSEALERLRDVAGPYARHMGQGAAFAAQARLTAGIHAPHTEAAVQILCGRSMAEAARLTDIALQAVCLETSDSPYEAWRSGIRQQLNIGVAQ